MGTSSEVHPWLRPGSGKRILLKALLLLGAVVFTVTLIESLLVYKALYPPPPPKPTRKSLGIFEEYPPHGYRLKPNIRHTGVFVPGISERTSESRELHTESNKHGFRGREFDEVDDRTRIAVLGDSFVFGIGVEQTERFTEVLERIQPEWRIDNLGMAGFGVDLMVMALEDVGLRLEPDVVVLCVYTDDFPRVRPYYQGMGFGLPRYRLQGDRVRVVPYPAPRPWDSLRSVELFRRASWKLTDGDMRLNRAILERFVELSSQHQFVPLLVLIPGFWEDSPVDIERRQLIEEIAQRHQVAFLDASGPLKQVGKKNAFIAGDIHLNAYGHEVLARALRERLSRMTTLRPAGRPNSTH